MPEQTRDLGAVEANETDGRRLRRARNRVAAVDALIELYGEGQLEPNAATIAERAGLSPRSLFRYFDDVADLVRAAIEQRARTIVPILEQRIPPQLPRADRIDAFVALRLQLFDTIGSVGRVARMRAWTQPLVSENLSKVRQAMRRQTRDAFAVELDALADDERRRIVSAIELLTSYEALDLATFDQGFAADTLSAALQRDIDALLPATT